MPQVSRIWSMSRRVRPTQTESRSHARAALALCMPSAAHRPPLPITPVSSSTAVFLHHFYTAGSMHDLFFQSKTRWHFSLFEDNWSVPTHIMYYTNFISKFSSLSHKLYYSELFKFIAVYWHKLNVVFCLLFKSNGWIKKKQFSPWISPMLLTWHNKYLKKNINQSQQFLAVTYALHKVVISYALFA